jgi:hypothetical protein
MMLWETQYMSDIIDLTILLFSLSILLQFDGRQLRVQNYLIDETI